MPNLGQFRDYNEHDVVNVFALSGYDGSSIVNRGTLVKVAGNGFKLDEPSATEFLGNPSSFSPTNVVSQRYGAVPKVVPANAADAIIGMTLFDVRETDENGELLKFRPRKAAELEAVISGQAVPVVRKGLFAYSGVTTGAAMVAPSSANAVTAGASLYVGSNATLTTYATGTKVGTALGTNDARGFTVIYLNV